MAKSNTMGLVGSWAFIIGVIIALLIGIFAGAVASTTIVSLLMILGLLVGLLNITGKEAGKFLMASVSLVIVAALSGPLLGEIAVIGSFLQGTLSALLWFVVPATIIVALRAIFNAAKN